MKTVQGEGNLKCDWNEQMWIPVMTPAMSNIITLTVRRMQLCVCVFVCVCASVRVCACVQVWDKDATKDEQVGTSFLDYKDVCAGVYRSHPVWVNVYGPPSGCTGHQVEKMLKYPDLATNWRCV